MLAFRGLVYLDVEKSGSTFVRRFLLEHVNRRVLRDRKHGAITLGGIGSYRFTSSREPLSQYLSLYRYGCDGKGGFRKRAEAAGHAVARLYDGTEAGFIAWLDALLDPSTSVNFESKVARLRPDLIGVQTARFLYLNLRFPRRRLAGCRSLADVIAVYRRHGLPHDVVRNEHLNEDMTRLVRGPLAPFLKDRALAKQALQGTERENPSGTKLRVSHDDLPPELAARLMQREGFMYQALGYGAQPVEPGPALEPAALAGGRGTPAGS